MAPKGTQVVMGSSTELPGSSAPTERPAYPGRPPVSAAARPGGAVQTPLADGRQVGLDRAPDPGSGQGRGKRKREEGRGKRKIEEGGGKREEGQMDASDMAAARLQIDAMPHPLRPETDRQ